MNPQEYLKAIVSALIAGLGVLASGLEDGLTAQEIVAAVIALLVAFGATFAIPNKSPTEQEKAQ